MLLSLAQVWRFFCGNCELPQPQDPSLLQRNQVVFLKLVVLAELSCFITFPLRLTGKSTFIRKSVIPAHPSD